MSLQNQPPPKFTKPFPEFHAPGTFVPQHDLCYLSEAELHSLNDFLCTLGNLKLELIAHRAYLRHIGHLARFGQFFNWEDLYEQA